EAGLVPDRCEVRVLARVLGPLRFELDRALEMQQRVEVATAAGLHAREVVEQRRMLDLLRERLPVDADRLLPVLLARRRNGGKHRLPGGHLVRLTGLAPERKHDRLLVERDRAAPQLRIPHEHELSRAEFVLVAVDREASAPAQHEVGLLVPELALRMLLDDLSSDLAPRVGVDADRAEVEMTAHRA